MARKELPDNSFRPLAQRVWASRCTQVDNGMRLLRGPSRRLRQRRGACAAEASAPAFAVHSRRRRVAHLQRRGR